MSLDWYKTCRYVSFFFLLDEDIHMYNPKNTKYGDECMTPQYAWENVKDFIPAAHRIDQPGVAQNDVSCFPDIHEALPVASR